MGNPVDSNYKGPVNKAGTGYNGQTGAAAQWNEGEGMWIDANGVKIRDDAITPNAPVGSPSAPGGPAGGGSAPPSPAMTALTGVGGGSSAGGAAPVSGGVSAGLFEPPSIFNIGQPSQANPALGQRNPAMSSLLLAMQKPRNY